MTARGMVGEPAACDDLSVGRVLVAAAVGVLLATACTGGRGSPAPTVSGSSAPNSGSGSVSLSLSPPAPVRTGPLTTGPGVRPGEVPPVQSAIARQHTQEGALAFAAYFIRVLDWSFATTDPFLLDQVSAPSCVACKRFSVSLAMLGTEGGHIVGGRYVLNSATLLRGSFAIRSDLVVGLVVTQGAVSVVRYGNAPTAVTSMPTTNRTRLYVSWHANRWQAVEEAGT